VAFVYSYFKSETVSEVYVNNVGTLYFYLSSFGLNIFVIYPVSLERNYVSDVTVKSLGV